MKRNTDATTIDALHRLLNKVIAERGPVVAGLALGLADRYAPRWRDHEEDDERARERARVDAALAAGQEVQDERLAAVLVTKDKRLACDCRTPSGFCYACDPNPYDAPVGERCPACNGGSHGAA